MNTANKDLVLRNGHITLTNNLVVLKRLWTEIVKMLLFLSITHKHIFSYQCIS